MDENLDDERGLHGNIIRRGVMLNSTKDTIDQLIDALDASFATL